MSKYCPICLYDKKRSWLFGKRRCVNFLCDPALTNDEYEAKAKDHVLSVIRSINYDIAYYTEKHECNPYLERLSRYEHAKGTVADAKKMHFIPDEYELPKFEL